MKTLHPIALRLNTFEGKFLGRFVGAFRVLDENGFGTDEVLECETQVRASRREALADAADYLAANFPMCSCS